MESVAYIAKCLAQRLRHHLMSVYYMASIMPHAELRYDEIMRDSQDVHGKDKQVGNHSIQ